MLYLVSCFFSSCLSLSLFYAYVLALFRRVYLQYTLHYKAKVFSDLDIRILEKNRKKKGKEKEKRKRKEYILVTALYSGLAN